MVLKVWNANQPTAAALRVAEVRRKWAAETRWSAVKTRRAAEKNEKLLRQTPQKAAADPQPKVEEKDTFLRVCTIDKVIGEGGFGKVYRVQYLGGTACLKTALYEEARESLAQEIRFLRELDGIGGAPKVLCTAEDETQAPAWFIMEYLEGDLLEDVIYRHPYYGPSSYLRIFVEMACELQLVHDDMDIVHNDLKFNNVIITPADPHGRDFHAHIFDFGLATRVGEPGRCFGQRFNPRGHYPPELFGHKSPSTPATDVYQFGLMMSKAVKRLSDCGFVLQWPQPDFLAQFIDRMLDPQPGRRPEMHEVAMFLQDLELRARPLSGEEEEEEEEE